MGGTNIREGGAEEWGGIGRERGGGMGRDREREGQRNGEG